MRWNSESFADHMFKAGTRLGADGGLIGIGACGGYVGGVMVLSQLLVRERSNFENPERIRFKTFGLAKKLIDEFVSEFKWIAPLRF